VCSSDLVLIEYYTPVFRRKHHVVQQYCYIVTLVQILAHASILRHAASGGELDPERLMKLARPERFELPTPWFVGISSVRK
jgi:hypothetical protein